MSEPRNVEDVPYVESADLEQQRPMREVIRDRNARARKAPRVQREAAFRERARICATVQVCLCLWPIAKAATVSEHEDWCPGHHYHLAFQQLDAAR